MKKLLAMALSVVMLFAMTTTAFADDIRSISSLTFNRKIGGEAKALVRHVKTSNETVAVSGYYYADEGRDVFRLINRERVARGLSELEWVAELVEPAIQRAFEQYVLWSHTRPDGSKWSSVSPLANGENLASGSIYDAVTVMDGWMNSPSHRENILDKDFTGVAVASIETDKMTYWVQLFNVNEAGKKAIAAERAAAQGQTTQTQQAQTAAVLPEKSLIEALNQAKSDADTASVLIRNAGEITSAVTKAASDWATQNSKKVRITAITTSGQSTQGQLSFDPTKFPSGIKTGVRVDNDSVAVMKGRLDKWFANKCSVIKMDATGTLAASVAVVAKVPLTELTTSSLKFYSYDEASNNLTFLDSAKDYKIDANGFLHFTSTKGGYIVITDRELQKK